MAGNYAGALAAAVGGEHAVIYEELTPGVYQFKSQWAKYHNDKSSRNITIIIYITNFNNIPELNKFSNHYFIV